MVMKRIKFKVQTALAKATYSVAEKGAGLASFLGLYQSVIPKKLQK